MLICVVELLGLSVIMQSEGFRECSLVIIWISIFHLQKGVDTHSYSNFLSQDLVAESKEGIVYD